MHAGPIDFSSFYGLSFAISGFTEKVEMRHVEGTLKALKNLIFPIHRKSLAYFLFYFPDFWSNSV